MTTSTEITDSQTLSLAVLVKFPTLLRERKGAGRKVRSREWNKKPSRNCLSCDNDCLRTILGAASKLWRIARPLIATVPDANSHLKLNSWAFVYRLHKPLRKWQDLVPRLCYRASGTRQALQSSRHWLYIGLFNWSVSGEHTPERQCFRSTRSRNVCWRRHGRPEIERCVECFPKQPWIL